MDVQGVPCTPYRHRRAPPRERDASSRDLHYQRPCRTFIFLSPGPTLLTHRLQTFTAYISQYDPELDLWEPYSGIKDMQLEFTMLDPHIRTSLSPVAGEPGKYSVTFRIPDRHGVFKFVVDYKRKGCVISFAPASQILNMISQVDIPHKQHCCSRRPATARRVPAFP